MGIMTFRRYRGAKARAAISNGDDAIASAHVAARDATPGTPLPSDFPARDLLASAPVPYTTIEDLTGATEAELTRVPGIGVATAKRILAAHQALTEA